MKQATLSWLLLAVWVPCVCTAAWMLGTGLDMWIAFVIAAVGFIAFFFWFLSRGLERWDATAEGPPSERG